MSGPGARSQPPESVAALLRTNFKQWKADPEHLGLDWKHYAPACPPLLVIGGSSIQAATPPLIIVSIEPLLADHFAAQVAYSTRSVEQYTLWNWSYFEVFPLVVGTVVQSYWRNMVEFVEGWSSRAIDPATPWSGFGDVMIELPYIPMHACNHCPRACRPARQTLKDLFLARVDALVDLWPDATFVVLASTVRRQLECANLLEGLVALDLSTTTAQRDLYGNGFGTSIAAGRLATRSRPRVFVRRGPLSYHTNPRPEGRRELGRRLARHR